MLVEESTLAYIEPGVTVHGMDIGRWLARQQQHTNWHSLTDRQCELLEQLGIRPRSPVTMGGSGAFERGVRPWGAVQGPHRLLVGPPVPT